MKNINIKENIIIFGNLLATAESIFDNTSEISMCEKEGIIPDEVLYSKVSEIIRNLEEENRLFELYEDSNDKENSLMIIRKLIRLIAEKPLFGLSFNDYKENSLKRVETKVRNMQIENIEYDKMILSGFEATEEQRKFLREECRKKTKVTRNVFYYAFLTNLEKEIEKSKSESERKSLIDYKYNTIFFESFYERELLKAKYDIRKVDIEKIEGLSDLSKLTMLEFRNITSKWAEYIAFDAIRELKNKNYLERLKNNKPLLKCYILYLKTALNLMNLESIMCFKQKMESEIRLIPSVLDYQDAINEILELVERTKKERKDEIGWKFTWLT